MGVAKEQGIRLASLDELYAAADYITLHVGLTPQTTGMINAAAIEKMKKGVRLVNCARGELVHEADLVAGAEGWSCCGGGPRCFRRRTSEELAADRRWRMSFSRRTLAERRSRRRKPLACRLRSRSVNT